MSDLVPRLISGGSSYAWARRLLVVLLSTIALSLVMIAFVAAQERTVFFSVLPVWIALGVLSVLGIAVVAVQDVRESRVGYTTAFAYHRDKMQLNPYTGEVIRRAGADMLTREEFVGIIRKTRIRQPRRSRRG